MFALGQSRQILRRVSHPAGTGAGAGARGFVLPRFLRRPVRWWSRVLDGDLQPPRYSAALLCAGFLAGSGLYGAHIGGHWPAFAQGLASHSGFAVENVRVTGHSRVSEIDIIGALELDGATSLFGLDAEEARRRIASLPWVDGASVRKSYPASLEVELVERHPFAIWQSGSQLSLIDRNGDVIVPLPGAEFLNLPLVIGYGAPQLAEEIVALAEKHPELASRIKAFIRIGDRRWDLRLANGITIRLPDGSEAGALAELVTLDRRERLLSRDIASVDLRLPDRMVIGLTEEGAMRRAAMIAERDRKKPGRGI